MNEIRLKLQTMRGTVKWLTALPEFPAMDGLIYAATTSFAFQAVTPIPVFFFMAGVLFITLLFMMTGELFTKYLVLEPEFRKVFVWEQEITGKFLLIFLVVVSLVFDLTVYLVANRLPSEFAFFDQGYLFVTITAELWLLASQMAGVITNIRSRVGRENIPPVMNMAVDQIRALLTFIKSHDRERLKRAKALDPDIPDFHRWYDFLTAEDFRIIKARVEARMQGEEVNEPLMLSADQKEEP